MSSVTRFDKELASFLSVDQAEVLNAIIHWLNTLDSPYITLGGYAGTGKTTLISLLRNLIHKQQPEKKVAFASYTGKASQVLKQKLVEHKALFKGDSCGTIHSLMYSAEVDKDGRVISWKRSKELEYDLLIIDEASMVNSEIWRDLLSYQLPIIAVGDHGQLPPIESSGFNLMNEPILRLEKIHRQAQGNPIIEVATMAREQGQIPFKKFSSTVMKVHGNSDDATQIFERMAQSRDQDSLILCSRNRTRIKLNKHVRALREIESESPQVGETLICLKNNYTTNCGPIFNGMLGRVQSLSPKEEHWYDASIEFYDDGRIFSGDISKHQFHQEKYLDKVEGVHYSKIGDRFDFGYALTVHKAQGSQASKVLLFEEYAPYMKGIEWNRWLYTAVTRASEELYIIQ